MRGEDLQRFITDWDAVLLECREAPDPKILESLFRTHIRRHAWMKQDMYCLLYTSDAADDTPCVDL
eukprot:5117649-Pyramimonas_sp.AAC.1